MTGEPPGGPALAFLRRPITRWERGDTIVASLAAVAVALRWPDRARWLFSWDANTFALALERYDVHAHRPHAPGYPVYVLLGRGVNALVPGANDALVALSLLFTAAAAIALYGLGRQLVGRAAAAAAVALFLAAPVAYVHSVTANAYTAEMAGSILVAWAAWRAHADPRASRLVLLAFAMGIAVGVRPSLALYLGPVLAWGALRPPGSLAVQARRLAPAIAVGVATCLAWFIPMVSLSGGYATWSAANRIQGGQVVFAKTLFNAGWPAVAENLDRLHLFLRWELLWVAPVLATLGLAALTAWKPRPAASGPCWSRPVTFLALWLTPALAFFATVYSGYHEGPSGYILVALPGLLLVACGGACWILAHVAWRSSTVTAVGLAALVVSAGGLVSHRYDVADIGYKEHDAWAEAWSHLPEAFPPTNTSIVALWNFAHVWMNFPDYTTYNYRPFGEGPEEASDAVPRIFVQEARHHEARPDWYEHDALLDQPPHPLPDGTRHLVLFDFQLAGENGGPRRVLGDVPIREAFLPNGWRLLVVDTVPDRPNLEDYFSPDVAGVPA